MGLQWLKPFGMQALESDRQGFVSYTSLDSQGEDSGSEVTFPSGNLAGESLL